MQSKFNKLTIFILLSCMILGIAGCGNNNTTVENEPEQEIVTNPEVIETDAGGIIEDYEGETEDDLLLFVENYIEDKYNQEFYLMSNDSIGNYGESATQYIFTFADNTNSRYEVTIVDGIIQDNIATVQYKNIIQMDLELKLIQLFTDFSITDLEVDGFNAITATVNFKYNPEMDMTFIEEELINTFKLWNWGIKCSLQGTQSEDYINTVEFEYTKLIENSRIEVAVETGTEKVEETGTEKVEETVQVG